MTSGITARKTKKGTSYLVRVRSVASPKDQFGTFPTLREAKAWQAEKWAGINKGEAIVSTETKRLTIGQIFDDYANVHNMGEKDAQRIKKLRGNFEDFLVLKLTPTRLQAWVKEMEQTQVPPNWRKVKSHPNYKGDTPRNYSASTIRKYYFTLKKCIEWHAQFKRYPFQTPFLKIKLPKEDNSRERRLLPQEEKALMEVCLSLPSHGKEFALLMQIAMETAMRCGEMLGMTWGMLKLEEARIMLPATLTKTKKAREVALTSIAKKLLSDYEKTLRPTAKERIFPQWQNSNVVGHVLKDMCVRLNIEDFKWHDLRHEAISRFFERTTLRETEICKITGHTNPKTLARYANLRATDLAAKLW